MNLLALPRSGPLGLTEHEASQRLAVDGENRIAPRAGDRRLALAAIASPFVALLLGLDLIFWLLGDVRGGATVSVMVAVSIALRAWQEHRCRHAVDALRCLVTTTATVRRRAAQGHRRPCARCPSPIWSSATWYCSPRATGSLPT